MNNIHNHLIYLLSAAIRNETPDREAFTEADWEALFLEARVQQVAAIIFPAVSALGKDDDNYRRIIAGWRNYAIFLGLIQIRSIDNLSKIIADFNKSNIPLILLKGMVLKDLYPKPEFRTMCDADILVRSEDVMCVRKLLESRGYYCKDDHDPKEIRFFHDTELDIEIHWRLTVPGCIDNADLFEKDVWANSVQAKFSNANVAELCPDNMILHLFMHMVFHMKNGGFSLRQLCDIILLIESREDRINWSLFSERIKLFNIERVVQATLLICNKYFKLKLPEEIDISIGENEEYIDAFMDFILEAGHFDNKPVEKKNIRQLLKYTSDDNVYFIDKMKLYHRIAFPSKTGLAKSYTFLHRYAFLYPVAWMHHVFTNVFRGNAIKNLKQRFVFSKRTYGSYKENARLFKWLDLK